LLELRDVKKFSPVHKNIFAMHRCFVHAVEQISFRIFPGEIIGLVGESGCGKTTIAKIAGLLEKPDHGNLFFNGKNIHLMRGKEAASLRKQVQFVFQDPYSSLNPRKTVQSLISMGLRNFHLVKDKKQLIHRVTEILFMVGLSPDYLLRFPREFSRGEQQRIAIARAIAVAPELLICDELVSALDVSVQAQIINLLRDLNNSLHLSMLFISHDLAVVKHISDRILVLYKGRVVESASSSSLFENTAHPYTRALISAIPEPRPHENKSRIVLKGDVTPLFNNIKGCCFADRCYMAQDICLSEPPLGRQLVQGHTSYCHFPERV
jgi:oligopeptide/dipeptide ABC transporter ATP-binding protein